MGSGFVADLAAALADPDVKSAGELAEDLEAFGEGGWPGKIEDIKNFLSDPANAAKLVGSTLKAFASVLNGDDPDAAAAKAAVGGDCDAVKAKLADKAKEAGYCAAAEETSELEAAPESKPESES